MSQCRFLCCLVLATSSSITWAQVDSPARSKESEQAASVAVDRAGDVLPAGAVARLGTTRFLHRGPVAIVGYSSDGSVLLTFSGQRTLHFWDTRSGKELRRLIMPSGSGLLSGDGKTLVLNAGEGAYKVVDVAGAKMVREFKAPAGIEPRLSHDGRHLLVMVLDGSVTNKINLWDTSTGKLTLELVVKEKGDIFTAATLSADGQTLVTLEKKTDDEKGNAGAAKFRFWEAGTGQEIRSVAAPVAGYYELHFTHDGKHLIARGAPEEGVRLIDAATGKEIRQFAAKQETLRAVLLSRDRKKLFVAGHGEVTQYDIASGKQLRAFPLASVAGARADEEYNLAGGFSMAVSPDGKTLALPAMSAVAFWDVQSGKEIVQQGHRDRIDSLSFSPDDKLVLTGSADGRLYLWDAAVGKRLGHFMPGELPKDPARVPERMMRLFRVRGAFSPDGKTVAGLWWGGKLHLWDTASGKLHHQLGGDGGHNAFALSRDGKFLALTGSDGRTGLYAARGKLIRTFGRDQSKVDFEVGIFSTAFTPDSRLLVNAEFVVHWSGVQVHVKHWELASGTVRASYRTHLEIEAVEDLVDSFMSALDSFVVTFAFAPDGQTLGEAGFCNIKLRHLQTGRELHVFGGREIAAATALFSPDGKLIVAGKHDGSIRLWDAASGAVLLDFPAHQCGVTALAFSADGRRLASGAKDASVLIWDWAHIRAQVGRKSRPAPAAAAAKLWADLARPDAEKAYQSIQALAGTPAETVAFLKARLRPVPPVEPRHLAKLLVDLDDKEFQVRKKGEEGLEKLSDLAARAISEQLAGNPSLESSRRLESLLKKLAAQELAPATLQVLRAIEALELIGTAEAGQVLATLAKGAPGHRVTEEAQGSLERLRRKNRVK